MKYKKVKPSSPNPTDPAVDLSLEMFLNGLECSLHCLCEFTLHMFANDLKLTHYTHVLVLPIDLAPDFSQEN